MKGGLALLAAAGLLAAAESLPYSIGLLGGKTIMVGLAFDARGRPAVELIDAGSKEGASVLVGLKVRRGGVKGLAGRKASLSGRSYALAVADGSLKLTLDQPGRPALAEVEVPLEKLVRDGRERLARECAPLAPDSAYCFRLAPGRPPAVNVFKQTDVWDFAAPAAPGGPRPAKADPRLPRPAKVVPLPGERELRVENERYRVKPSEDGRSVSVEKRAR